jgi:hypothetical protein
VAAHGRSLGSPKEGRGTRSRFRSTERIDHPGA